MTTITLHQHVHVTASTTLSVIITAERAVATETSTGTAFCSITPPMRKMELFRLELFFDPLAKTQVLIYNH